MIFFSMKYKPLYNIVCIHTPTLSVLSSLKSNEKDRKSWNLKRMSEEEFYFVWSTIDIYHSRTRKRLDCLNGMRLEDEMRWSMNKTGEGVVDFEQKRMKENKRGVEQKDHYCLFTTSEKRMLTKEKKEWWKVERENEGTKVWISHLFQRRFKSNLHL